MNKFCLNCQHRKISDVLKEKFNKYSIPLFVECPKNDKHVSGCTVKYVEIDWENFVEYLKKVVNEC